MRGMVVTATLVVAFAVTGCGDGIPPGAAPASSATPTPTATAEDIGAAGAGEDIDGAGSDTAPATADDDLSVFDGPKYTSVTVDLRYAAGVESAQFTMSGDSWGMALAGDHSSSHRVPRGRATYRLEATVEGTDGDSHTMKDTATFTFRKGDKLTVTVSPTSMKVRKR